MELSADGKKAVCPYCGAPTGVQEQGGYGGAPYPQDPYGQGYNAMTALIAAIKGGDYSATQGKCEYLDGIVLSCRDKAFVNTWRADNGLAEIN